MAKAFCPYCEVMLTKMDLDKGRCEACGKGLPLCPSCDAIPTKKDLSKGLCDACGKKLPLCPNCNVILTGKEREEGWCDTCGKKLPLFLTNPRPAPRPAAYPAPAPRRPDSKLYRFAWWMDRVCLGLLLIVLATCVAVPALLLLLSQLLGPINSGWDAQSAIMMVQVALIFILLAGMLVAKGLKVLCGTDGS
jgi:hypothetical protein